MLTVMHSNIQSSPLKTKQNVNFMSSKYSLADRMLESYSRRRDHFRDKLIYKNKDTGRQMFRIYNLILTLMVAFGLNCLHGNFDRHEANPRTVKETEVLHEREKELDEKYKKGTLLFEEYVHELNNLASDYEKLEAQTTDKLDRVVKSRVEHSNLKSAYNVNPKTGKYDYEIALDYENKVAKVNILDNSNVLNDSIPE